MTVDFGDHPSLAHRGIESMCEASDDMSIISPQASAHIPKTFVDSHPELLVSMVTAARAEWATWTETT